MTGLVRRPLLGAAILEGPARVRGTLFDCGEYPGLVLGGGDWVHGELYRIPDIAARLRHVDREEWYDPADEARSLYVRRRVTVEMVDGSGREAWVYVYNGPPGPAPRIPSGDWRAHLAARAAGAR